jgi:hypothetical protein
MDEQAINELERALKWAGVESNKLKQAEEDIISVFNSYRRRSRSLTEKRKKIEEWNKKMLNILINH